LKICLIDRKKVVLDKKIFVLDNFFCLRQIETTSDFFQTASKLPPKLPPNYLIIFPSFCGGCAKSKRNSEAVSPKIPKKVRKFPFKA
jgi:hypothetical protein